MVKFGFYACILAVSLDIFLISAGAATISTYVFMVLCSLCIIFQVTYNSCEVGLHNWGNWEHYLVSMQRRKCKDCGKTQVVR
jgi:hypothetical protein